MADVRQSEVAVLDSTMAYREAGAGRPVLLLHGNPTSSYLWRHVLAAVAAGGSPGHRWIAPDLIGMGESGKPDIGYRLTDHLAYVDAFVTALDLSEVVLVGHDWGVAIVMDRLRRHPDQVRGLAFMEGHLRPLPGWDAFDDGGRGLFQDLRAASTGERMVLEDNFFIETLLPAALVRPGSPDALATYAAPYGSADARRPLLQWAREIPIGGEPADVAGLMEAAVRHLATSAVPKLVVHSEPGVLVTTETVSWCRQHLSRLSVADVGGPAGHFLPEDRPDQVADALITWVQSL